MSRSLEMEPSSAERRSNIRSPLQQLERLASKRWVSDASRQTKQTRTNDKPPLELQQRHTRPFRHRMVYCTGLACSGNRAQPMQEKDVPSQLKHSLLPAQGSEGPDIRDEQRRAKLVVVSKRPQRKTPVFKARHTRTANVALLHQFSHQ